MPIQNAELLAALRDDTIISRPDGGGAIAALDALMKADPTTAASFRGAILAKKDFWHGFNAMVVDPLPANDDNFLTLAGAGAGQSFAELHKLAVQRRVQAGLKASGGTLDEAFLVDLINNDANNARAKLATKPAVFGDLTSLPQPGPWDPTSQNFLTDPAIDAIKAQAKEQLLLNKIKNTVATEAQIKELIAEAALGDGQFQAKLQLAPWNLTAPTAANLTVATGFTDIVKKAALEKGLALAINEITPDVIGTDAILTTLNNTADDFKQDFGDPYDGEVLLDAAAVNKAKGQLGQRFLLARLPQLGAPRLDDLAALAAQGSVADFARVLKTHRDLAGHPIDANNFVDHAITPTSLPILRQTAALQALKIKIAQCEDPAALDALIAATTKEQVKQVLTDKPAFGFSTSPAFREALNNLRSVDDIVVAAQVQKRLLAAGPAQLKALATVDGTGTYANLKAYMKANLPTNIPSTKIDAYLTPEKITEIRQRALLGYISTPLRTMDGAALDTLLAGAHIDHVRDGVRILMGNVNDADDLTAGGDPAAGFAQQIRAYAGAEKVVRNALAINANTNYNDITAIVNDTLNHVGGNPLQTLVGVLPPKEKQILQERVVTDLVDRFPDARPTAQLTALATAKTDTEFTDALRRIGITEYSWVNKDSRAHLQALASEKALTRQISATAQFGAEAHPELLALVKQLPLNKQQELLSKPEVMKALLNVQDAHDELAKREAERVVKDILGEAIDVKPFVEENYRLYLINQIASPEIARIIAQQSPPVDINPGKIRDINNILHAATGVDGARNIFHNNGGANSNYVETVKAIQGIIGVVPASFYPAFGLNAAGNHDFSGGGDAALRVPLEEQLTRNAHMIAKARGLNTDAPDYRLITFCAALPKANNHFDNGQFDALKADLNAATSLENFITTARTKPYHGMLNGQNFEQQLTPEVFKQLKREQSRQIILDNGTYAANLGGKQRELKAVTDLFEKMKKADDKVRKQLERFGNTKSIDWFNPAFHAAAKQNAEKLGPEFLEFAKGCDAFVTQLAHQKAVIDEQLASLPSQTAVAALPSPARDAQKRDIEAYRKVLIEKGNLVGKELEHYQKMQKVLRGDPANPNPLMQKGLVKTVEEAKAGKQDIRFHFESECGPDRPASEMAEFFKPDWRGQKTIPAGGGSTMSATGGSRPAYYHAVPVVAEGMVRPHRISYGGDPTHPNDRLTGGFLEQRGSDRGTPGKDGSMEYLPSIKLTVNAFPQKLPGPPPTSDKALHEARVNFSMAMACQILAGLHDAPNKDNRIILDGTDPEELKYLWSGLVAMGKANPDMAFGPDAIKVISGAFQPKNEMGTFYGLSSNSLYEKGFKESPALTKAESFFTEASGHKKPQAQTTQDLIKLSQMFKGGVQVLREVEQSNATPAVVSKTTPKLGG
ncbi:interaptin [Legionella donaldsonii]|uniref:Interaptin n=1 Tax=Legionella donaldsonii TaxID=45060 RepID=A0A378JG03_9GAMM|nr:hypothetical protein [Legionella donaldsonii]STX43600.1 interaptin [Legionella donaldsonii]